MIHSIIFDIGKVLVDYDWNRYMEILRYEPEVRREIGQMLFCSPLWKEVDRGVYTEPELIDLFCREKPQYRPQVIEVMERFDEAVSSFSYSLPLIRRLKRAGYQVYVLSNYGREVFERSKYKFDFLSEIDGGIISYEVKLIKPESGIYEALLSQYRLEAEECIFFDDIRENVDAAVYRGIHGVQVTDGYDSIVNGLKSFGIDLER